MLALMHQTHLLYRLNAPLNAAVPGGGAGVFGGPCLIDGAPCLVAPAEDGGRDEGEGEGAVETLLATSAIFGICLSINAWKTF